MEEIIKARGGAVLVESRPPAGRGGKGWGGSERSLGLFLYGCGPQMSRVEQKEAGIWFFRTYKCFPPSYTSFSLSDFHWLIHSISGKKKGVFVCVLELGRGWVLPYLLI